MKVLLLVLFLSVVSAAKYGVKTVESGDTSYSHYIGGDFHAVGGVRVNNLAVYSIAGGRFDDINAEGVDSIVDMVYTNDGLFVVGDFTSIGGVSSSKIAFWNGVSFCGIADGLQGTPTHVVKSGSDVYVFGSFQRAGNTTRQNHQVAHYRYVDGVWSNTFDSLMETLAEGTGYPGTPTRVFAQKIGGNLVFFVLSGGRIYRGSAADDGFTTLEENIGGITDAGLSTKYLIIVGSFVDANYNYTARAPLSGLGATFEKYANIDTGIIAAITRVGVVGDAKVYIYCDYRRKLGDTFYKTVVDVGATVVKPMGSRFEGVERLLVDDDQKAYAIGSFQYLNYITDPVDGAYNRHTHYSKYFAVYNEDQNRWLPPFAGGTDSKPTKVLFEGGKVYMAGGGFSKVYNTLANGGVAYEDEKNEWHPIFDTRAVRRGNQDAEIHTMLSLGDQAYAIGGNFDYIGDETHAAVVGWTSNKQFSSIGGGLYNLNTNELRLAKLNPKRAGVVYALAEGSTGDGILYAGGIFSASETGACLGNIAQVSLTGKVWSAVGGGVGCNGPVYDIVTDGDDVFFGGSFTSCGASRSQSVAKFVATDDEENKNGGDWETLGLGVQGTVYSMIMHGGDLWVAGGFQAAGGVYSPYVTRWTGDNWEPVNNPLQNCDGDCPFEGITLPGPVFSIESILGDIYVLSGSTLARWGGEYWQRISDYPIVGGEGIFTAKQQGYSDCIAANGSTVLAATSTASPDFQYLSTFDNDKQNFVPSWDFDGEITVLGASSFLQISVFFAALVVVFFH